MIGLFVSLLTFTAVYWTVVFVWNPRMVAMIIISVPLFIFCWWLGVVID